jgi:hypothetical protein
MINVKKPFSGSDMTATLQQQKRTPGTMFKFRNNPALGTSFRFSVAFLFLCLCPSSRRFTVRSCCQISHLQPFTKKFGSNQTLRMSWNKQSKSILKQWHSFRSAIDGGNILRIPNDFKLPPRPKPDPADKLLQTVHDVVQICCVCMANDKVVIKKEQAIEYKRLLLNTDAWLQMGLKTLQKKHISAVIKVLLWLRGLTAITILFRFPENQ